MLPDIRLCHRDGGSIHSKDIRNYIPSQAVWRPTFENKKIEKRPPKTHMEGSGTATICHPAHQVNPGLSDGRHVDIAEAGPYAQVWDDSKHADRHVQGQPLRQVWARGFFQGCVAGDESGGRLAVGERCPKGRTNSTSDAPTRYGFLVWGRVASVVTHWPSVLSHVLRHTLHVRFGYAEFWGQGQGLGCRGQGFGVTVQGFGVQGWM